MLRAVSERDAYANLALPALLRERGITGRDAAFATELTYGTCRTRGLLDAIIGAAAGRPPEKIDPVLLDLLRLGAYQLLRTRVEHARRGVHHRRAGRYRIRFSASRFRQRRAAHHRGRDEQSWVAELAPPVDSDPVGHAAFVHAHPRWIAQAFADALGADAGQLDALLASDDERPLGASRRAARRADRRRAGRSRSTARSGATRRTPSTCPVATPVGSSRSVTAPRWCRTRAASWWRGH